MSKTSHIENIGKAIVHFLDDVAVIVGVVAHPGDESFVRCGIHDSYLILSGSLGSSGSSFHVNLRKHDKLPVWLFVDFEISDVETLPGHNLLIHYGKRFADNRGKRDNDFDSSDLGHLWTIRCAKDLEALFLAHARLARIMTLRSPFEPMLVGLETSSL